MAKPGTLAGAHHPLLGRQFTFTTSAGGIEFFDLDIQHVNSYIRFTHNGTGQKVFRLPLAGSVAAGAYVVITWGTIPGASAVAVGVANGSADTVNFGGAAPDTGNANAAFLCIRTTPGLGGQTNNWNIVRMHNTDFV